MNHIQHKEWLNPHELMELYGIAVNTQAKWRVEKKIPYSKVGKFVRYSKAEINEWLKNHSVRGVA